MKYLHDYLIFSFNNIEDDEFKELLDNELQNSRSTEMIDLFKKMELI